MKLLTLLKTIAENEVNLLKDAVTTDLLNPQNEERKNEIEILENFIRGEFLTIRMTGMECYWTHLALEKLQADEDNFVDEEDRKEAESLMLEFYSQWHPQDKNVNKNWSVPKPSKRL